MKTFLFYTLLTAALCPFFSLSHAQNDPGAYMTSISKVHEDMDAKYMAYMSAVAHSRRAKKIEKTRQQVLESIQDCKYKTSELPYYNGDKSLRQSSLDYIQICYHVFNEDYAKIVNIEDIAEQSYDEMQAYILLQEKTEEKLDEAGKQLHDAENAFAAKYNVKLVETHNELSDKIEMASKLNSYQNKVYLLFFKCNWEDGKLTEALNANKLNDVEQARNALVSYADEGLKALDTLRSFDGDASLAMSCKQSLQFYKKMGETDLVKVTDYYLKKESFNKMKQSFESKPDSKRTKADVDAYNKSVNDMNLAVNTYNATNNKINSGRTDMVNNWNQTEKSFQDLHMPVYKK